MFVTELEGGTLTSSAGTVVSLLVRLRASSGARGGERGGGSGPVVGTLLGPEGTGDRCSSGGFMLVVPPGAVRVFGLAVGDVGRLSVL